MWPKHKSSCTGAKDRPTKGSHGLRSHSRISSVIGCPFEKTSGVLVSRFRSVSGQNKNYVVSTGIKILFLTEFPAGSTKTSFWGCEEPGIWLYMVIYIWLYMVIHGYTYCYIWLFTPFIKHCVRSSRPNCRRPGQFDPPLGFFGPSKRWERSKASGNGKSRKAYRIGKPVTLW